MKSAIKPTITRFFTLKLAFATVAAVLAAGLLLHNQLAQGQVASSRKQPDPFGAGSASNAWTRELSDNEFSSSQDPFGGATVRQSPQDAALVELKKLSSQLGQDGANNSQIEKQLRDVLMQYFTDDMERRAAELDKIKARVRKMEGQLKKRMESKQEIIDLQIKLLQFRANGLGMFDSNGSNQQRIPFFNLRTR